MLSALSPFTYFRRNPGKTLPMAFVIMLSVTLVSTVVTIIRSIDLTVFTLYGYYKNLTGITPRNSLVIEPAQVDKIKRLPELGYYYPTHSYAVLVKTIFGKMVFPIFGMEPAGRQMMLDRCGVSLLRGRLPAEGAPEAVVSEEVARDLGLKVGDVICEPNSEDAYAPVPIRLVGVLRGSVWMGLISKSFVDSHSPFTFVGALCFAPTADIGAQRRLDEAMASVVDKRVARVWRYSFIVSETRNELSNLYLILNIVTGLVVFAIAFVCALLSNIYFTQRLPEIATLAAIGYSRGQLLRRSFWETVLLSLVGWIFGGGLSVVTLLSIRKIFLEPKGLLLNPVDPVGYLFTVPLPIAITLFAIVTIGQRLSTLDPVSIIERRG